MKKLSALCFVFCLVIALAGCGDSKTSSSGADSTPAASTESKAESNTESKTESNTESNTESSTESSTESYVDPNDMSYPENPYAPHEIEGAEITTTDTERIINAGSFTVSVPLDWKCFEVNLEDGGALRFLHPTLGEKCEFSIYVTGAEYKTNRTQDEYLRDFRYEMPDMKIESFTTEKLDGIDCSRMVSTYTDNGTKMVSIDYLEVVRGLRLFDITAVRPAENEELESVLDDIIKSVKFPAKG